MGGRDVRHLFPQRRALQLDPASARLDVLDGQPRPPRLHGERRTATTSSCSTRSSSPASRKATSPTRDAKAMFEEAFGRAARHRDHRPLAWTAGYTLVAEKFQRGRIFLGGDAVHLFTPTGGLGYNTAVEDAVNLGWKLAAVLQGLGRRRACSTATRPSAGHRRAQHRLRARLRRFARAVRAAAGARGRQRRPAKRRASAPATISIVTPRFEFNIPGITFGGRYDGSPIIVPDGTAPPPDAPNTYRADRAAPADARRICGSATAARSTTRSASSSRCWSRRKPADAAPFRAAAAAIEHAARRSCDRERRGARSLRRRSGADPARPDRGLARNIGGRRGSAAPRRRISD